ncbi:hypothetical protein CYY_008687 [Polysphondylium violaceum]|uniref:Uncharacterized protein n=1 Tax=Polysphondylium violaceum TaxID=133409 RepID=A0A8J4PN14_9MYCE|nr:hypothetical protein CYY_008687 [Polysphondylium violaceum]
MLYSDIINHLSTYQQQCPKKRTKKLFSEGINFVKTKNSSFMEGNHPSRKFNTYVHVPLPLVREEFIYWFNEYDHLFDLNMEDESLNYSEESISYLVSTVHSIFSNSSLSMTSFEINNEIPLSPILAIRDLDDNNENHSEIGGFDDFVPEYEVSFIVSSFDSLLSLSYSSIQSFVGLEDFTVPPTSEFQMTNSESFGSFQDYDHSLLVNSPTSTIAYDGIQSSPITISDLVARGLDESIDSGFIKDDFQYDYLFLLNPNQEFVYYKFNYENDVTSHSDQEYSTDQESVGSSFFSSFSSTSSSPVLLDISQTSCLCVFLLIMVMVIYMLN